MVNPKLAKKLLRKPKQHKVGSDHLALQYPTEEYERAREFFRDDLAPFDNARPAVRALIRGTFEAERARADKDARENYARELAMKAAKNKR